MITKAQALDADVFHYGECIREVGPRGAITEHIERWRRNGTTQVWKTRPDEFSVPVKFGMRSRSYITNWVAENWHTEDGCNLPQHVDYPHEPGRLIDCRACEAQCYCNKSAVRAGRETVCVYCAGEGNEED